MRSDLYNVDISRPFYRNEKNMELTVERTDLPDRGNPTDHKSGDEPESRVYCGDYSSLAAVDKTVS